MQFGRALCIADTRVNVALGSVSGTFIPAHVDQCGGESEYKTHGTWADLQHPA